MKTKLVQIGDQIAVVIPDEIASRLCWEVDAALERLAPVLEQARGALQAALREYGAMAQKPADELTRIREIIAMEARGGNPRPHLPPGRRWVPIGRDEPDLVDLLAATGYVEQGARS